MPAEKSILQRIREKELELSMRLDLARRTADETVRTGQEEARQMIQSAEREAAQEGDVVFRKQMESVQKEIDEMGEHGKGERDRLRHRGEGNLDRAVERIVHDVTLE